MTKRWSDFLFAFSLRLLGGLVLGALAGLLFGFRMLLRWEARGNMGALGWWLAGWALMGAVVAVARIPEWQTPWYKPMTVSDSDDDKLTPVDYNFRRVSPELYNRTAHPSLKQYHDFVRWLRENSLVELEIARADSGATKAALILFFQRGFRAGLVEKELTELLPSILAGVRYSESEYSTVIEMLNALDLDSILLSTKE